MTNRQIKAKAWRKLCEVKWFGPILISFFMLFLSFAATYGGGFIQTGNFRLDLLIIFAVEVFVLTPFSMGYKIYMLSVVRDNEEVSVGRIFDGYAYLLKLLLLSVIAVAVSLGVSYVTDMLGVQLEIGSEISLSEKQLVLICLLLIAVLLVNVWLNISFFTIYDNGGKVFKGLGQSFELLYIRGGIFKYIKLYLSFIIWFFAIMFSMGILIFFVVPYLETSAAVLYDLIKRKDD